ncbi:octopamine receptor [Scaptodrosophila lebanonensis]|uniref:Octopamine receptor n=1 Tax=Drosophila lebanonensis TaxID=7225 RepID=A0A6J2THZ6_DROLE|nr:octopamine receptor [Scaptodrosophila lebanonensis]
MEVSSSLDSGTKNALLLLQQQSNGSFNVSLDLQQQDNINNITNSSSSNNSNNGGSNNHQSFDNTYTATPLLLSAAAAAGSDLISTTLTATVSTVSSSMSDSADIVGMAVPSVNSYFIGMAWPKAIAVAFFLLLILATVIGNTLVILAVLTTRRLRTVTNCFVMNLAITDWLVGTCVMPPAVVLYITGSWRFGWILCDIWVSLDILLCTGSILSLCAISLDRYLAVTQPLTYSKKRRSKRLALLMILVVWITALSITCPPYLGWYEQGRRQQDSVDCRYNQNKGYVVFSAMGSFFIPLTVMLYVYLKIGYVLTSRRQRIVRDANVERTADPDLDGDNFISESEHYHCNPHKCLPMCKTRWRLTSLHGNGATASNSANSGASHATNGSSSNSIKCNKCLPKGVVDKTLTFKHQPTFYELVEVSRLSSLIHCSAISCKYGGPCMHSTAAGGDTRRSSALHYNDSQTSFAETSKQQQQHHHHHHQQQQQHIQHNHHHHPHHHAHQRMPMRVSTTKRDTKTAKTLTIVMGGLIACWLPFFVYYLLIPFLPRAAVLEGLMSFLTWVGWVNCAINPFIYAFYNPDFRTAFWRLTCRRICKQKPPPNHMAMFRG